MSNIFKLHKEKPVRLGHKKAKSSKKQQMEDKGQQNLFEKPSPQILSLPKKMSAFEQAYLNDEQGNPNAKAAYLKAVESGDYKADAYCNLGILEAHEGDYVKAIDYFSLALATDPRHYEAHFNLANLYFDNENLKLAKLHYETAKNIEPEDPNIYFNLGLVQAMIGEISSAIKSLSTYSQMVGNKKAGKAIDLVSQLTHSQKA
ncbi:MAG: tetratricopeptide repeat protein [Calditrichaeota bacterium]|nr:MAG: tetratricopeptide repeat protein [Calditrichota bacterium]MBL1207868.1 tetratricopeptide repeat protein [Calditrichota bacterium]NOG47703.1 tetratricopeptide repeat protein [Calditrichota bacterium]